MNLLDGYLKKLSREKINITNKKQYFVYALWKDERIIYIGRTTNLYQRISSHTRNKEFQQYSYLECSDKLEMDHVESYLIGKLKPELNKTLGDGMMSLQKVRARIRELGEDYKYSQKYYVNELKKIVGSKDIEFVEYNDIDYISYTDAEKIVDFARKVGAR